MRWSNDYGSRNFTDPAVTATFETINEALAEHLIETGTPIE